MDSPLYVLMSEGLRAGDGRDIGPAHHGYPALVALAGLLVHGREWPGRVVSLIAGLALVALVHRLARTRLSPPWSALASALVALHPMLSVYSVAIMTESSFLAIVGLALLLVERRRFLAAGLALGAGYAVRPEAAVIAGAAALFGRGRVRGTLLLLLGAVLAAAPYLGWLRVERGTWVLTPKTVLVRPQFASAREAEWRLGDAHAAEREPRSLAERVRRAAPSMAANYLPFLGRHARLLLEGWPWPLMLLSLAGLAWWRGALLAPLPCLMVLPLLAVPLDARFTLVLLPSLALGAAAGGAAFTARAARRSRPAALVAIALAAAGLAACWSGPAGARARAFDDGPVAALRQAGAWLRAHGRPGAHVMDRKVYVPFFAGMTYDQLPDDDYDTIVEHARASGADYLVLEEYTSNLRPQMVPLIADPAFRAREARLRLVYLEGGTPHAGVAIFEVMRDSSRGGGREIRVP
jgi:4-amino-4-deoxy-L-arabinose transferase-like glycosyltransferase